MLPRRLLNRMRPRISTRFHGRCPAAGSRTWPDRAVRGLVRNSLSEKGFCTSLLSEKG